MKARATKGAVIIFNATSGNINPTRINAAIADKLLILLSGQDIAVLQSQHKFIVITRRTQKISSAGIADNLGNETA